MQSIQGRWIVPRTIMIAFLSFRLIFMILNRIYYRMDWQIYKYEVFQRKIDIHCPLIDIDDYVSAIPDIGQERHEGSKRIRCVLKYAHAEKLVEYNEIVMLQGPKVYSYPLLMFYCRIHRSKRKATKIASLTVEKCSPAASNFILLWCLCIKQYFKTQQGQSLWVTA